MPDKSLQELVKLPLTALRYGLARKLNKVGKFNWAEPVKKTELEELTEKLEEANLDPGQRVDLEVRMRQVELNMSDPTRLPEELQKLIHLLQEFKLTGNLTEEEIWVTQEFCAEWQSSIFSEWELRRFIDELRSASRDRRIEAEIQNVKDAMKTGRAPYKVDLETPARQLLWGAHLLYLICNPHKMDGWRRNRGKRNLAKSSIWGEVLSSHHVQYLRALFGAHIFNLLRDNDILVGWGEPGSWFAFFLQPKPGRISLDLLYSLMVGFDHARACAVHEISHAVQSKGMPDSIRDRQIQAKTMETRIQLGIADPGEDGELNRLEQEITLRKHFLNAAEDNCINHFTVEVGKLFGQDYGYSLNYFYTTMGDVGRRYSGDEDPYPEETAENRFSNLTYIISRVFLVHNGLFENTPEEWRKIKARPEWITARSRYNPEETLSPAAAFTQLMEMCEEVEQLYPPLKEMAGGPDHYDDQCREFSQYRFALITQMWDLYAHDLCQEMLDNSVEEESDDPFEKFNKKLEQEQPPQQPPPEVKEDNPTPPSSSDDDSSNSDDDQDPSEPPPDQEGEADADDAPTDPEGDDEQPEDSGETSDQGDPSKGDPQPTPPPPDEQEEEEDEADEDEEDEEEGYAPPPPEEEAKQEEESEEDIHQMDDPPEEEEQEEQQQDVAIDEAPPEESQTQDEGDDADSAGDEGDDQDQEDESDGGDEGEMEIDEWEPEEIPEEQLVAEEVEAPDIEHPEDREDDDDPREMPNEDGSGQGGDGSKHDVLKTDFFPDQPMASLRDLRDALRESQKPQEEKPRERPKRPPVPQGQQHQKMEVPDALTLDQLAQGSWEDFAKRVAMHATIIALMAKALEKLKNAQLKLIYKVSRKHSLTPQGGDLRRYDEKATNKLITKLATNEKFDKEDLNLFFRDKKIAAITRPTRVILIDGSRSMSMGSSPFPMDKALQEAIIDYKASEIAGYDTYITMFGPDHPLVLARPGDNPTVIGKNIEKVRGGLNTMTQVAPGILKTIEMVAHRKKFSEPYVGFTNFVFYSDGDVDDPRQTQVLIEKIFQYAPKSTFDFVLITEKQMTPMDQLVARLQYNNPLHKIGVVKGDAARKFPMALMATYKLTNRLRSLTSGFADPAFVRSAQFRRLLRHLTT